ncbi:DUF2752 domain-containing protein [Gemmata sp. JC717]|uniref:DUF2752 domain-containing protein n=1 Tax=Gemmata algarum TaxID=2975278 RepID=A0ABU5EUD5_9BACT|nr:DUF2752 domain-containing protein [Gemmata algarum]MDY3554433.1 DUF2752 domain-containing protein [Gemmata algarum]MDY3558574.1 DUF2752 domain-containing protein [Gemmata algarum]
MTGGISPATVKIGVRAALVALAAVAAVAVMYLIATTRPTPASWYPKCIHYRASGFHCPGCGTGRALHHALNGNFVQAARNNILAIVLLPTVAVAAGPRLMAWVRGRPAPPRRLLGARWVWLLVVLFLLFWVGRNIPVTPFTYLAPQELSSAETSASK